MDKKQYAVMGNPIAHSLSPTIHEVFAQQTNIALSYQKILVPLDVFEEQVHNYFQQGGDGLNITRPFKERAYAMSDVATPRCHQAKSANTLWLENNQLYADNTDGIGFITDLQAHVDVVGRRILILGAGGAVRGILPSLLTLAPAQLCIANRNVEKAVALAKDYQLDYTGLDTINEAFDLIINGMALDVADFSFITSSTASKPVCYDLNYNKEGKTPFIRWAEDQHCLSIDGLGMLVEQAKEAFFLWHGVAPDTKLMKKMLQQW